MIRRFDSDKAIKIIAISWSDGKQRSRTTRIIFSLSFYLETVLVEQFYHNIMELKKPTQNNNLGKLSPAPYMAK